jgi:hypothetical protein
MVPVIAGRAVLYGAPTFERAIEYATPDPAELVLMTWTRTYLDASEEVKVYELDVADAISAQVELSEELCHWYV